MRRRSFLKAMLAAAAGCLALVPKVTLSTREGTLKPAWTEGLQAVWTFDEDMERSIAKQVLIQARDDPRNPEILKEFLARAQPAEDRCFGFGAISKS